MSLLRTVFRNIISNWAGYAVNVAVGFFLTPFILHALGNVQYGVWTLVTGLTGYYGLLDLGFSAGITQFMTWALAEGDYKKLNRIASTGVIALSACGIVVVAISLIIAKKASLLFNLQGVPPSQVRLVIILAGISFGSQLCFFTYSAVFTAMQRFDLSNLIGISTRIGSAVATVLVLRAGQGLVGLAVVVTVTNVVDYAIRWRVSQHLLPLRISFSSATREDSLAIVKYGGWNVAIAGSARLISYTDSLVIAAFLPVAVIAPFAIAASLRSYFDETFMRVGYVLFPTAARLDAAGDTEGLARLYLVGSRLMFTAALVAASTAILWAPDFFRLWLGRSYTPILGQASIATLFTVLITASAITAGQRIGYQVLLGTRKIGRLATLLAAEGLANLVLSVALIRPYGVLGVALGTLIPAAVFEGFIQPFAVSRVIHFSPGSYVAQVFGRPALSALSLVPLLLAMARLRPAANWMQFFALALGTAVLASILGFGVGLTADERRTYIYGPIGRLFPKRTIWLRDE